MSGERKRKGKRKGEKNMRERRGGIMPMLRKPSLMRNRR